MDETPGTWGQLLISALINLISTLHPPKHGSLEMLFFSTSWKHPIDIGNKTI